MIRHQTGALQVGRTPQLWEIGLIVGEYQKVAIELLVGCQALDFHDVGKASSVTKAVYDLVRSRVPVAEHDRAFYTDIASVTEQVRNGEILATVQKNLK